MRPPHGAAWCMTVHVGEQGCRRLVAEGSGATCNALVSSTPQLRAL